VLGYGTAGALTVAGVLCAALIDGIVGQALFIALISIGLGGALLLLFYEVGLSEDRARAREERRRGDRSRSRRGSPSARDRPTRRRF
jgi:hypothetical protein